MKDHKTYQSKMKTSIPLLFKLLKPVPVVKWIVLYSIFVSTLYRRVDGYCLLKSRIQEWEANNISAVDTCNWMSDCKIQCVSGRSQYAVSMQSIYDEQTQCHSSGVKLILPADANNKLGPNWFTADMHIAELELDLGNIYEFTRNAFTANVFSKVKKLTVKNLYPCEFRNWVFMGLWSLEHLQITDVQFETYVESGALAFANQTLKSFELIEKETYKSFWIDGFTGNNAAVLPQMEYVKIKYNLSRIDHLSFTTIPNVRELDLSDCSISSIATFTFDHFGSNLQMLSLERNRLTTVAADVFMNLPLTQTGQHLTIRLSGNPWDCNCALEEIKHLMGNYSNFDDALCSIPGAIYGYPIRETEFCPNPITTTSTTTTTTTTTTEDPTLIKKHCSAADGLWTKEIALRPQTQSIHLTVTAEQVSVSIENNTPNLALIWFKSDKVSDHLPVYHQSEFVDCAIGLPRNIVIKNLDEATPYTFCLMNTNEPNVSPLDCLSYYHQGVEKESNEIWLLSSSKPLAIIVIIISLIGSIIVGMLAGILFVKCNEYDPFTGKKLSFSFRLALHCTNSNVASIQDSINPYFESHINDSRKASMRFPANGEQKHMSGFGNDFISNTEPIGIFHEPPPIPPRPSSLEDDDSYYATIRFQK